MTRKHSEPTVSRHIELFESDWEFLQEHFGRQSDAKVGVSNAIRQMIRKGVSDYRARVAARVERVAQAQAVAPAGAFPALDKFFVKGPLPDGE